MTVMAETLIHKYSANRSDSSSGAMMALQNVGDLLSNKLSREQFDGVTNHIVTAATIDNLPTARKAFNEGYLSLLETLIEI
jgi:hypothetical protein